MGQVFEFVKVGGTWFYWCPDIHLGTPEALSMVDGSDKLLDSIDSKLVRVQLVEPPEAHIVLSKMEEDEYGATYMCESENYYNGIVWVCTVANAVFNGEYPESIYLKNIT